MTQIQKISLFLLRISLGWLFFWAGITKVLDPSWSAAGYLEGAKTFTGLYHFFASSPVLPVINLLNEWGLTLIGVALILGVFTRVSSYLGAILMLLYYLPILQFPYPNPHSFIVDEHIVYIVALLLLASFQAGKIWGFERYTSKS